MIFHKDFSIQTEGRFQAVDITDDVMAVVPASGVVSGTALIFCPHTTCSIMIGAPGPQLDASFARAMEFICPEGDYYAHDDLSIRTENLVANEPANAPAHILNAVMGKASESIPIIAGRLALAEGQRVLFIELDSARPRQYTIQVTGE
ncbi:MAG: secondary thiamine-phosphate synthase enzyme YjbQ [Actinomycetota bacterium]|nr:secondary thiamine-phosphate synthase enzyme YjbQ [Actinomycetota bacterium]